MRKARISIIVPVYNAESYLEDCIDSLLNQTYTDIEVILVDDGSNDNSAYICDRYKEADPRIKVLHQNNSGVSAARNAGIELAKGEFLCFVDADDLIHNQMLEILMKGMDEKDNSISCCYCQSFLDGEGIDDTNIEEADPFFECLGRADALSMLNEWRNDKSMAILIPCAKIYSRELFRDIRYPVGRRHEDELIAHYLLAKANHVYITELRMYYYRQHSDSFMNTDLVDLTKHGDLFEALEDRICFFEKNYPMLLNGAVHHLLRECNSFYDMMKNQKNGKKTQKILQKKYRKIYRRYWKKINMKEKLTGGLFGYFPSLYHYLALSKFKG